MDLITANRGDGTTGVHVMMRGGKSLRAKQRNLPRRSLGSIRSQSEKFKRSSFNKMNDSTVQVVDDA